MNDPLHELVGDREGHFLLESGGRTEWIVWGRGTALLLPRYLKGRTRGPLFCTDRHLDRAAQRATVIMAKGHWRSIGAAVLAAVAAATELLDPPQRRA